MSNAHDRPADASSCIIYHGSAISPSAFAPPGETGRWRPADELFSRLGGSDPAVLIADASIVKGTSMLRNVPSHVVIIAADVASEAMLGRRANFSIAEFRDASARGRVLSAACNLSCTRLTAKRRRRQVARTNRELRALSRLGMALMDERDLATLLQRIVTMGKELTDSDGGGIFLIERPTGSLPTLRLALYDSNSLPRLEDPELVLPVDHTSIVGHAASILEPVVIDDAYALPPGADYTRNAEFDERYGYRLRSMLIVPLVDHHDRLVGVLTLVNRVSDSTARITSKAAADRFVLPYTTREVRLARSLAGQAAISIENAYLYGRIESIFENFVKAAVTAIDDRDPTTAGHSVRVAQLTLDLAKAAERDGRGGLREIRFSREELRELRYAALLHDFGKLSVHEDVLIKAKKLPPLLWERVNARFDLIHRTIEVTHYRERTRLDAHDSQAIADLEAKLVQQLEELDRLRSVVRDANEPHVEERPTSGALRDIASRTFEACDGSTSPFLTEEELHYLQLPRGTLDARERAEVEAHVDQTFRFLSQIPWTDDLKNLAAFAYGHHEKLDGSGYPRQLRAEAIPLQTRLITLADIFDALTASDRPYKPAVPVERALTIIQSEANSGLLDADLVRVMIESQAYRRALNEDWHRF